MTKNIFGSRWYILALTLMTTFFIPGILRMSIVVLLKDISVDLSLNLVEVGFIWGMDPFAGVFISIPAGLVVDRFGIKRTMIAMCLLGGLMGASRGLAADLATIILSSFLFGLISTAVPNITPKIAAVWFGGKRLGLINSLIFVFIVLGQMMATMFTATVFSPLLGGWRNVFFIYSIPAVLIAILWITTPEQPGEVNILSDKHGEISLKKMLLYVMQIKEVWIYGMAMMATIGLWAGVCGYLPIYLRDIGWTTASADGLLTLLIGIGSITTIPLMMIADRFKPSNLILALSIIIMSLLTGVMFFAQGLLIWIVLLLVGVMRGFPIVFTNTLLVRIKDVGSKYAGTVVGLANTVHMMGGFIFPPLGNSLAQINLGLPFVLWAFLCPLLLIGLLFIRKRQAG